MKTFKSIANPSNTELIIKFFTRLAPVAQVSKPAVSPISKSAGRDNFKRDGLADGARVWKPAIQQTWKSALPAGFALLLLATAAARAGDYHVFTAPTLPKALTPAPAARLMARTTIFTSQMATISATSTITVRPTTA